MFTGVKGATLALFRSVLGTHGNVVLPSSACTSPVRRRWPGCDAPVEDSEPPRVCVASSVHVAARLNPASPRAFCRVPVAVAYVAVCVDVPAGGPSSSSVAGVESARLASPQVDAAVEVQSLSLIDLNSVKRLTIAYPV